VELREAIRDLSRHPEPELSGALPDVSAAVECTMLHLFDSDMGKFKEFVNELNEKGPFHHSKCLVNTVEICFSACPIWR